MSSNGLPSEESKFIQAYARNTELRAKIEEASLLLLQEISERQGRLEMALMKGSAVSDAEHTGATGRLDKASLERAHIRATLNKLEGHFAKFLIEFDTFRRETRNNEPLLARMWRAWRALKRGDE